ncbi:MAG: MYXO-CTERM sorting domain-containing protein [Myxococcales bacterium]
MLRALFPRAVAAFALCALVFSCKTETQPASSSEPAASVVSEALGAAGDSSAAGATGEAGATGTPACTVDGDCGNGCGVCTAGVCSVAPNTVVCRAAVDATCDVAEKCDGTNKDCPQDAFQPPTLPCHPSLGLCDPEEKCDGAGHCPADAKLGPTDPACRPATGLCDVAEVCDGTGNACPTDKFQPATLSCHPSLGTCDPEEKCDGAGNCPTDKKLGPSDPPCRPALLACDVAESCDGTNNDCPADRIDPGTKVCRPAVDTICDVAETCDGLNKACPNDTVQPNTVPCRPSAGDCDVTDNCDGNGKCSTDLKLASGSTCRAAKGLCDKPEVCDGVSVSCPVVDVKLGPTDPPCRPVKPGDDCDVAELCNGTNDFCPGDGFKPMDTVCRAVAGDCDVAEKCTGSDPTCPGDVFEHSDHACRSAGNDPTSCDVTEYCAGTAFCPPDLVAPSSVICRPLIPQQPCDQPEHCDGTTKVCPSNTFKPKGASCDDGLGCTQTDTCDEVGHCNGTPNNSLCPQEDCALNVCDPVLGCQRTILKAVPPALPKVCRKAIGSCDVDEVCDGTNATCPSDIIKPATTTCQAASCTDANLKPQILCDGAQGKCPVLADISCGNYACGSTTECRTTCITSADCGTAFYCLNNACVPRIGAGQQCKSDAECTVSNPHCVDGVCCDTTCVGQCEACNTAGKLGTCIGVKGDPIAPRVACAADGTNCDGFCDPSNRTACQFPNKATSCRDPACDTKTNAAIAESFCTGKGSCALTDAVACEPYACNGAACAGNCTADAQCASDAYCQAGKCTPKGKPADKCTTDKQCGSGHCADGVCCDTACTGQCEACSGVPDAKAGTCSPVTGDPLGKRTACAASDAACGGSCDGKNRLSCIYPAQGKVCRPGACTDGKATVNAYCDGHGACPAAVSVTCEKGCEGKVCAGDECVSDKDCGDDAKYCAAGVCTAKGDPGAACSVASSCKSGFCTDGVCCDSACLGQCEACDASGSVGTCSAVPKGDSPHGGRTACATDGSVCGGACDGSARNNCKYPFDVVCRAGACTPGAGPDDPATSIVEASCVGNGSCPAEQQQLCGTDGCDSKGKLCDGACAADRNACKTSEYCSSGECVPRLPVATACANDAQCESKFCVDGVCCNQRCGDQCAACDVPGSVGKCTPVVGGSHGGRAACGGVGTCGAACDGTVLASCSFAGKDVSCGEPFCSAGLHGDAPLCDGEGVCASAVASECKSYRCDGSECSTACVHNTDCVKQLECRDGQCVPPLLIDAVDKGSCGCSVPGSTSHTPASVFYLLGLCAAAALRRRRAA